MICACQARQHHTQRAYHRRQATSLLPLPTQPRQPTAPTKQLRNVTTTKKNGQPRRSPPLLASKNHSQRVGAHAKIKKQEMRYTSKSSHPSHQRPARIRQRGAHPMHCQPPNRPRLVPLPLRPPTHGTPSVLPSPESDAPLKSARRRDSARCPAGLPSATGKGRPSPSSRLRRTPRAAPCVEPKSGDKDRRDTLRVKQRRGGQGRPGVVGAV